MPGAVTGWHNARPDKTINRQNQDMKSTQYQPKTGAACSCKPGVARDNCPHCEGTGQMIDFAAIRAHRTDKANPDTAPIPTVIKYTFDPVTVVAAKRLTVTSPGTVSEQSHLIGMREGEPLIVMLDALIKYAKAHKGAFFSPLAEDYVLGPDWLAAAKGVRGLFNGNGAIAHTLNRSTDSKDNGTVEAMFWQAMEIAGFTEADL